MIENITLFQFWDPKVPGKVGFTNPLIPFDEVIGTLLNALFGTEFDVMNEDTRCQTTHGIWLSKAASSPVLILDVEGTDGRERAEDQDFERKSALFSLAVSEVLMINVWEHSVGLYHGANMSLLKTVMDVHLQIFANDENLIKTTLLFVVRDYIGVTPVESLKSTLMSDISRIWTEIKKPPSFTERGLNDLFSIEFSFLPHKILKPTQFLESTIVLSDKLMKHSEENFFDKYNTSGKIVPADGLALYFKSIWDKVASNKDLNLPNQQELLAQYRCDELIREALVEINEALKSFQDLIKENALVSFVEIADKISKIKGVALDYLELFCRKAAHYTNSVYERKFVELSDRMDSLLLPTFSLYVQNYINSLIENFIHSGENLESESIENFRIMLRSAVDEIYEQAAFFKETLEVPCQFYDFQNFELELKKELMNKERNSRYLRFNKESEKLTVYFVEKLNLELNSDFSLNDAGAIWANVSNSLKGIVMFLGQEYDRIAEILKIDKLSVNHKKFQEKILCLCEIEIRKVLTDAYIKNLAKNLFDRKFKYDDKDHLIIWTSTSDIDIAFDLAKSKAVNLFNVLNDVHIDLGENFETLNMHILEDSRMSILKQSLFKDFEAAYIETKRSLIAQSSKVPLWIYLLLLVLGWNELMALLSSPFYILLLLLALSVYISLRILGLESFVWVKLSSYLKVFEKLSILEDYGKQDDARMS